MITWVDEQITKVRGKLDGSNSPAETPEQKIERELREADELYARAKTTKDLEEALDLASSARRLYAAHQSPRAQAVEQLMKDLPAKLKNRKGR
jgi:hypothetical protein